MKFPDPESADPTGLLCVGGKLTVENLVSAYRQGVFPWPQKGLPLLWFSPPERGVLFFSKMVVPKSTIKAIRQKRFSVTFNCAFEEVIARCASTPRAHEASTWILPEMISAYTALFRQGKALSVEAWIDQKLVGGLYGVLIENVFSGESMFFEKSESSKVCLVELVEYLKSRGHQWIDTQMVTPLVRQFGGHYIPRSEYLRLLRSRQAGS